MLYQSLSFLLNFNFIGYSRKYLFFSEYFTLSNPLCFSGFMALLAGGGEFHVINVGKSIRV